jgi:hypothetical protein
MKPLILILALCCAPLSAQQTPTDKPADKGAPAQVYQQKLFILKYADPQRLMEILRVFNSTGASTVSNNEMHALAVSAPSSVMQAIEDAITKLDTPAAAPKDFDFTVYLVVGTEGENIGISAMPKDLDSVVTQLRGAFPFKNYRLLDMLTIRSRAGQTVSTQSSGGSVLLGNVNRPVSTTFRIGSATLSQDGNNIRLERMTCHTAVPYEESPGHYQQQSLQLDSDLDIKEGQKVVVGRMGITNQQAMFVVITVKIVQ